jgi:hypothetical protein
MVDTCVIRALINSDTLDENTGEYLRVPKPGFPDPIYSGSCKFTIEAVQVRDVDSQGQDLAVADGILRVPVTAATALVAKDHTAVITVGANDSMTITAIIQAGHAQTFATARRFPVQITT